MTLGHTHIPDHVPIAIAAFLGVLRKARILLNSRQTKYSLWANDET
jgi:hypothetical protein